MPRFEDLILRSTRALQPAANAVAPGTLYYVTDQGFLERSNGTTWESYSGSGSGSVGSVSNLLGFASTFEGRDGEDSYIPGSPGSIGATGATGAAGAPGSSGDILVARLSITEAQLEALGTTPLDVIAAQGAGKIVVPIYCMATTKITTAYGNTPTLRIRYTGNATSLLGTPTLFLHILGSGYHRCTIPATDLLSGTFDPANKAVQVSLDTNPSGAGVGTAKVMLIYTIEDALP